MTTITAKIIADSVSHEGIRLTTLQLRYPRWIHAEQRTHRVISQGEEFDLPTPSLMADPNLSRNASSSRAVPVERMIQDVLDDPAVPLHWGKNQKGMQADEEHDALVKFRHDEVPREAAWLRGRDQAVNLAKQFAAAGYHKQIVNRLLEPFSHINVVVTATDWDNFFHLRDHPDAEPHIALLAREMKLVMERSIPERLHTSQWHLPYVDQSRGSSDSAACWDYGLKHDLDLLDVARRLSVARCASVSYKTVDGQPMTIDRAVDLYDKLVEGGHWSPFEHQAQPDSYRYISMKNWEHPTEHGNLRGWRQFRKQMPRENGPLSAH